MLEKHHPEKVLTAMKKDLRKGKVFIDWSQNAGFKTTICTYSLRARSHPTVSTPVSWEEVESAADGVALSFEASEVLERVASFGDLFAPVAAAWSLARIHGIAGLSLHALAREVGIRQPSLYAYFDSKHALYDAMFADGNRQLLARLDGLKLPKDPRGAVRMWMRTFVAFGLEDPARFALLFQRPIPGFEPSAASYAYAEKALGGAVGLVRAAGLERAGDIDCFIAMVGGLMDTQLSNDPGGDRWVRHLDRLIGMYLDELPNRRMRR
jgi:AcrR family transcriptional regulator